jgi:hypothetical protein
MQATFFPVHERRFSIKISTLFICGELLRRNIISILLLFLPRMHDAEGAQPHTRGATATDTLSCGHLYANRCRHGVHCCVLNAVAEWLHQNMHSARQICIHTSSINSPYCAAGFAFAHQSRCAEGLSNRRWQQQKKIERVLQGGCHKRRVGKRHQKCSWNSYYRKKIIKASDGINYI